MRNILSVLALGMQFNRLITLETCMLSVTDTADYALQYLGAP
jgi:hypothetical protein